ncbi:DUF5677 domain-containing protein [Bradyrhizobium betae]|nr:DUF5677 domain-containing protein [Bradyrhizobium betae]
MTNLEKTFEDILVQALSRSDLTEDQIAAMPTLVLKSFAPHAASEMLKGLKRAAPKMLREHKKSDAGFERRNYRRWKKPLDLLELLWNISEEVGGKFNQTERPAAVVAKDYQFEALVSLHARALLISREVLCLLYGGYPDGALSRWRSLHEIAVTAVFLQKHDQEVSHRYLASFPFAALNAAKQLNEHAERANMTPFLEEELAEMKQRCDGFEARFGKEMHNERGWASPALKNPKPTFAQLEKAVALDHWRPRYRWASQHTHGGYRPALAMLGTAESTQPVHLVGQSNSGFTDPIHMTAISLNQVTSSLLIVRPTVDNIVFLQIISDLSDELGEVAFEVEKHSLKEAQDKVKVTKRALPVGKVKKHNKKDVSSRRTRGVRVT